MKRDRQRGRRGEALTTLICGGKLYRKTDSGEVRVRMYKKSKGLREMFDFGIREVWVKEEKEGAVVWDRSPIKDL